MRISVDLPGAVRAEQAEDLAARHRERHAVERADLPEVPGDRADLDAEPAVCPTARSVRHGSSRTVAAIPGFKAGSGSIATLTPKTWSMRWSSVWMLRGVYSPFCRISTTLPGNVAPGVGVHRDARRLSGADEPEARLGDVHADPDLVELEDRRDRLPRGDEIAGAQIHRLEDPVGRCAHDEVLPLPFEERELALLPGERGGGGLNVLGTGAALEFREGLLRDPRRRGGAVVGLLAGHALAQERLEAAPLPFGVFRIGARPGDLLRTRAAPGLVEGRARAVDASALGADLPVEKVRFELDERLALFHRGALVHAHRQDASADQRADLGVAHLDRSRQDERAVAPEEGRSEREPDRAAGRGEQEEDDHDLLHRALFLGAKAPRVQMSSRVSRYRPRGMGGAMRATRWMNT